MILGSLVLCQSLSEHDENGCDAVACHACTGPRWLGLLEQQQQEYILRPLALKWLIESLCPHTKVRMTAECTGGSIAAQLCGASEGHAGTGSAA